MPAFSQTVDKNVSQSEEILNSFDSLNGYKKNDLTKLDLNYFNQHPKLLKVGAESEINYHIRYYSYLGESLEHRRRMFTWQYYSQIAIFILVSIIVLTGLTFSWLQFRNSIIKRDNLD